VLLLPGKAPDIVALPQGIISLRVGEGRPGDRLAPGVVEPRSFLPSPEEIPPVMREAAILLRAEA